MSKPYPLARPLPTRARRFLNLIALGAAGFVGVGLLGAAAMEHRQALWGVVRLCVADAETTGLAFPCLAVDLSQGEGRGYVVLRPPVGRPDTILSPTRKSVGIEDPWLQGDDAPDFFAAAWNARGLAPGAERWLGEPDAMGLGVNSRFERQQDQLHIHIGCVMEALRLRLRSLAPTLVPGAWAPAPSLLPGHEAWALRTGESDISRLRPFRWTAQKVAASPWGDLAAITLAVLPARMGERTEFILVAFPTAGGNRRFDIAADDFLDARCKAPSE